MTLPFVRSLAVLGLGVGACLVGAAQGGPVATAVEQRTVRAVDADSAASIALLEQMVNINSGTGNLAGVRAVKDLIAPRLQALGFEVTWHPMEQELHRAGDLTAVHACPAGAGKCGRRMLLIGHMDTVFEPYSKFQKFEIVPGSGGKVATGPGVNDMKGGLVVMLLALQAMKAAGALDRAEIRIVLSGDEEGHGSPVEVSRKDMVDAAKVSDLAMEFESGTQNKGVDTISIARRSSTSWTLKTTGASGHSSQIFGDRLGFGAIYELTRIVDKFRTDLREPGLTYNVGLVAGGQTVDMKTGEATAAGKSNIVAPVAEAHGDMRTVSDEQTARVQAKMQAIVTAHLPGTGATIEFGEGYPAMAPTEAGHELVKELNAVNRALGLPEQPELDPMLRGAGDIAFVAPYVPGLVGTGAMGEGAHAETETVFLQSVPTQAKRFAVLMERFAAEAGPVPGWKR